MLKEQLPLRISEQNRLWLALAAYNQGMGHMEDARVLAARQGQPWGAEQGALRLLLQSAASQ